MRLFSGISFFDHGQHHGSSWGLSMEGPSSWYCLDPVVLPLGLYLNPPCPTSSTSLEPRPVNRIILAGKLRMEFYFLPVFVVPRVGPVHDLIFVDHVPLSKVGTSCRIQGVASLAVDCTVRFTRCVVHDAFLGEAQVPAKCS